MVNGMGNLLNIENITNGLLTLQKLKQIYNPNHRAEGGEVQAQTQIDKLSLMKEILSAATNFVPKTREAALSSAFNQSNRYSSAYRELKQHVREMATSRSVPNQQQIFKALKLAAPIFDHRQKLFMDKFLKIIDILQS